MVGVLSLFARILEMEFDALAPTECLIAEQAVLLARTVKAADLEEDYTAGAKQIITLASGS